MKFLKSETILGEDNKVIHYKFGTFEISASSQAVVLNGVLTIEASDDLDTLALFIAKAWQHHGKMKNDKKME